MKSARHQLILLGLIGQAFSWDDWLLPLLSGVLWVVCLTLPRKEVNLGQIGEFSLIAIGIGLGHVLANAVEKNIGAFVFGYGLTLVQAVRLMRRLNRREKVFSIFVACFQVGVSCTIVLDYRFMLIFLAALILIPKALAELEHESYASSRPTSIDQKAPEATGAVATPLPIERTVPPRLGFGFSIYAGIIVAAILFYVSFPRSFGTQLPAPRFGAQRDVSMLDSVLDPSRSGGPDDGRVVLQIEGQRLGYLRCLALVDFDGQKWSGESWDQLYALPAQPLRESDRYERRRVRVKNSAFLSKVLPTDGFPVAMDGKFFRIPNRVQHGIVKSQVMWNTANNFYEYWTIPQLSSEELNARQIKRFTAYPEQSQRLATWLDQFLETTPAPLEQARRLEDYFKRNFTYNLGAPQLSRVDTADDFIFNQRQGHCERFAAHLALLLRMKGIPSRVVIGYLPNAKGWFTGGYTVRFRDAHAWTEAWFKGTGWVQFDATPAATIDRSGNRIRELLDAADFIWYSQVVAFDASAQNRLLNETMQFFGSAAGWLNDNKIIFLVPISIVALLFVRRRWREWRLRNSNVRKRKRDVEFAEHSYGQMLRALAKRGFHREPAQTPLEFLSELQKKEAPFATDAQLITRVFCETRYGDAELTPNEASQIKESLTRLATR